MAEKDKSDLRRRAENIFKKKDKKTPTPQNEAERQLNIQELQIHQIELEMQQEEIKRDRDEIKQSLDYWQTTFDSTADLFMLLDKDFRIIRANAPTAQFLNLPLDQIIGQNCFRLLHGTNDPIVNCPLARLKTSLKHETAELYIKEKDSWIHISVTPVLDENGKLKEAVHIIRDITESKKAEEKLIKSHQFLQRVINLLPVRIFWKDKDLKYLGCNEVFARDAGRSSAEEMIGKDDFQMGWKDQAEVYRADDQLVINTGNEKLNFEELQNTPSGDQIWLRTSKVLLSDEQGKLIGILGMYDDITERKKVEEVAKKRLYELEVFYKAAVGREERIIELKKEVEGLKKELGK